MKEDDLEAVGMVLGVDHRKITDIENHDLSITAMDAVFDNQAELVVCPACSRKFSPLIPTCPDCGLQFS